MKLVESDPSEGFPPLEIEETRKPRSFSEPMKVPRNESSPKLVGTKLANKEFHEIDNIAVETSDDSQHKSLEFVIGSSLEKSSKSSKSLNVSKESSEEQEDIPLGRPRGLTVDVLCNIRTNWDDLYKTGESVQEGKESENWEVIYNRLETGNVENCSDPDELMRQESYPSRENLSIKFDEGDTAVAHSEEGLAALCVGKCLYGPYVLIHLCIAFLTKRVSGKQCRSRSDNAECGI